MSEAAAAARRGQEFAARLFIDRCIIDRPGPQVMDPETLKMVTSYTPVYPTAQQVAAGQADAPCKVQQNQTQAAVADSAGQIHSIQSSRLDVPVGTEARVGDRARITSATLDPSLVGNKYRLEEQNSKTFPTAQRWKVQEITS